MRNATIDFLLFTSKWKSIKQTCYSWTAKFQMHLLQSAGAGYLFKRNKTFRNVFVGNAEQILVFYAKHDQSIWNGSLLFADWTATRRKMEK